MRERPVAKTARLSNGACGRNTTKFENAHGTVLRELLYPLHPWFELQVAIHEALEKPDGLVFRCTVSGSDADRWLEVPAWMFERAACPDHVQLTATPFIDTTALSVLADLVRQVLKDWAASSNAPLSGASKSSHDQNWREAHVSINVSAAVSQHEGTPKITGRSSVGQPQQIDLFGDERQNALMAAPAWQELPVETQAAVTNLMARLLLEYVQGSRTGSATEAGHDL